MAQLARSTIIFCAAGSGGHIFAAIATLKAFQTNYPTLVKDVVFVGSTLTMEGEKKNVSIEERLCARMGIPFQKIRMGKLQRRFSFKSIALAAKVVIGFWDAWKLLRRLRPKVIAAFGGYVTFPMVIVGKLLGAKIVLHEQTSSIGLTNKILQRYADTVAVTFASSLPYFKKAAIVVGSPTMYHIHSIKNTQHLKSYLAREKAKLYEENDYLEQLELLEKQKGKTPILLMSGGSQGSHFLNERMGEILPELLKSMYVVLQVGENELFNDYDVLLTQVKQLPADLAKKCIVRRFVYEEYGFLMSIADLFVGRSGANTVYQVGMNGTRAVFIPIPWVTHNEQFTNAMILVEKGQAAVLEERNCTGEVLLQVIHEQLELGATTENEQQGQKVPAFPIDADQQLAREIGKLAV